MKNSYLSLDNYIYDSAHGFWHNEERTGISYSDGDEAELRVATIIKDAIDLSVLSPELAGKCTDWPSRYHLSGVRANLLRPIEPHLKGSVLEIGAGCGAITRYLGEVGGQVLALEGSQRRAAIAASRTRDLENVTVVCDRFDHFQSSNLFDVVTLIGVLEYARIYGSGENPVREMLRHARSFLKPEGILILAIENQLGLKYFAGAPEDHTGEPMFGIQGLYTEDGVVTFGRKELESILSDSGYSYTECALPFPDYKLPTTIVTPAGLSQRNIDFDPAALASFVVKKDWQNNYQAHFSMECAWAVIGKNALLADLANSFLFLASPARPSQGIFKTDTLAYHYSSERLPEYCKEAAFVNDQDRVRVRRRPLAVSKGIARTGPFFFELHDEYFITGHLLGTDFFKIVSCSGWQIASVGEFLKRYIDILLSQADRKIPEKKLDDITLPGSMLDCIPQNIIVHKDGSFSVIDQEWGYSGELELGYLVFRSLIDLTQMLSRFSDPKDRKWLNRKHFFQDAFLEAGFSNSVLHFERYFQFEMQLQSFVSRKESFPDFSCWIDSLFSNQNEHDQVLAERERTAARVANLEAITAEQNAHIANLETIRKNLESELKAIHDSRGWKLLMKYYNLKNFVLYKKTKRR